MKKTKNQTEFKAKKADPCRGEADEVKAMMLLNAINETNYREENADLEKKD